MKKISVIIPIYNVEKYLSRCLDSVINQTYTNLEIIVVNDGSTDSSGAICDEYAKRDSRIIVIHKENGGLSDARNKGLDMADGEYIGFVDSDDFISSKFYEILYNKLIETNSDIVFCNYKEFWNNTYLIETEDSYTFDQFIYSSDEMLNDFYNIKYLPQNIVMWNKLFKRDIWKDLRFPKGKYHEDEYVIHDIFHRCHNICMTLEPLYYYFQRSDSIMNTKDKKKIIQKHLDYIEAINLRLNFSKKYQYQNLYNKTIQQKRYALITAYENLIQEQISIPKSFKKELKDVYHLLRTKEKRKYFILNNFSFLSYLFKKKEK